MGTKSCPEFLWLSINFWKQKCIMQEPSHKTRRAGSSAKGRREREPLRINYWNRKTCPVFLHLYTNGERRPWAFLLVGGNQSGCFYQKRESYPQRGRRESTVNESHLFAVWLSRTFLWRNRRKKEGRGVPAARWDGGAVISSNNHSPSPHFRLRGNSPQVQVVCIKLKKHYESLSQLMW